MKTFTLSAFFFLSSIALAEGRVTTYTFHCMESDVGQNISKDGKTDGPIVSKVSRDGVQTETTTGDTRSVETTSTSSFADEKGVVQPGESYTSTRTTKTIDLGSQQVREVSDIKTTYTLTNGARFENGSQTRTTTEHEIADYKLDIDGSKILVKDYMDGSEQNLEGDTNFELTNLDGTRVEMYASSKPRDLPLDDGSTWRDLETKSVCLFTIKK